eukprot:scaffold6461_cov48-Attheya_sp.AAC.2
MFSERLLQRDICEAAFSDPIVYSYNNSLGLPAAREAAAYFLAKRFVAPSRQLSMEMALQIVNPEHVALGSGCAAMLSNICLALAEKGEAVLIPAPYYAAFEVDMKAIAGLVVYPVALENPAQGPTPADLEAATRKAERDGIKVKMLLLTNPNNPLGVIYGSSIIRNCIQWARNRKLETIVDEIYGLSVHQKDGSKFQSVTEILDNDLGTDVHMLWGLSKDFAASGFRVGLLYTQNELLLQALSSFNGFSLISHPMQMVVATVLKDDAFVDSFLDYSRSKLYTSYSICTKTMDRLGLPYVSAEACMFVYVDFSSLLPSKTVEAEEKLSDAMLKFARIVLTPGSSQRDPNPGWFRICYAYVSPDVLEIGMERLTLLVEKIKKHGLENIKPIIEKV